MPTTSPPHQLPDARTILIQIRKHCPAAVHARHADGCCGSSPAADRGPDTAALHTAFHETAARHFGEAILWRALARDIGDDPAQPLPDDIGDDHAAHIYRTAAAHVGRAMLRTATAMSTWFKPTSSHGELLFIAQRLAGLIADVRFVNTLTRGTRQPAPFHHTFAELPQSTDAFYLRSADSTPA